MLRLSEICCLDGCEAESSHIHSHIVGVTRYKFCTIQHEIQFLKKRPLSAGAHREPVNV